MRITESAAYLKGLVDGLELDTATKEGKIITKMIDVLEEMAIRINDIEDENDELYAYIEEMGADIVALEDDFYGEDDAEYDDLDDLLDDEEVEDEDYYEVECPSCGEKICFAADVDIEKLACPACGELIGEIEFVDEECDGDCSACTSTDCEE